MKWGKDIVLVSGDGKVEQFMLLAPEGAVVTHIWRSLKLNYAMARMVYQSKAVQQYGEWGVFGELRETDPKHNFFTV